MIQLSTRLIRRRNRDKISSRQSPQSSQLNKIDSSNFKSNRLPYKNKLNRQRKIRTKWKERLTKLSKSTKMLKKNLIRHRRKELKQVRGSVKRSSIPKKMLKPRRKLKKNLRLKMKPEL